MQMALGIRPFSRTEMLAPEATASKPGREGSIVGGACITNYTLAAKDPKQHNLKDQWNEGSPATDFGSNDIEIRKSRKTKISKKTFGISRQTISEHRKRKYENPKSENSKNPEVRSQHLAPPGATHPVAVLAAFGRLAQGVLPNGGLICPLYSAMGLVPSAAPHTRWVLAPHTAILAQGWRYAIWLKGGLPPPLGSRWTPRTLDLLAPRPQGRH